MSTPGVVGAGAAAGELPADAVDALLDAHAQLGYNASLDFPIAPLFAEQLKRNPGALVVLSLRSTPEVWADSFLATIAHGGKVATRFPVSLLLPPQFAALNTWMMGALGMEMGEDLIPTKASALAAYVAWERHVRASVPARQLLVHRPGDGWGPLCAFLGRDVPDTPFPRAGNDRAFMVALFGGLDLLGRYFPAVCAGAAAAAVLACRSQRRRPKAE